MRGGKTIYDKQKQAIDYITDKFRNQSEVLALLVVGSIAHQFNTENSDVDLVIVISEETYKKKKDNNDIHYWESASDIYNGGYFDGKFVTIDYLESVAKYGNEPSRFSLHDAIIQFDKTNTIRDILDKTGTYPVDAIHKNTMSFLAQFEGWKWYCDEALAKNNKYLLDMAITKFILFAGRLILLDNRLFFPYHKWLLRVVENAPNKPNDLMNTINNLLNNKTSENVEKLYRLIKDYKDWANGIRFDWCSYFANDVELKWMSGDDYIENI